MQNFLKFILSILLLTSEEQAKPIELLFTGDLMFDRYIREHAIKYGNDYILEDVKSLLLTNDLVIADLEGPITTYDSISMGSVIGSPPNFVFTFDPSVAQTLYEHNIRLVNIGNNHILNFGYEGLAQTKKFLTAANIGYFGNVGIPEDRTKIITLKNMTLGFVNYNEFVQDGKQTALEDIAKLKNKVDLLILMAHWGPEYITEAPPYIQELAHTFIDNGVDLIIGGHPHVVQQKEVYNGKTIYYSLGNFVMDQYFEPAVMQGLLVKTSIDPVSKELTFKEFTVKMDLTAKTSLVTK